MCADSPYSEFLSFASLMVVYQYEMWMPLLGSMFDIDRKRNKEELQNGYFT